MTEIGESVRIFGKILQWSDRSGLNLFSMRDMNRLKKLRQNAWSNKRNNF